MQIKGKNKLDIKCSSKRKLSTAPIVKRNSYNLRGVVVLSVVLGKTTNSQLGTTGGKEGTRENRRVQLLMFMVIRVARAINVGVLVPQASVRCM